MTKDRLYELRAVQNGEENSKLLGNNNDDGHLKIEVDTNITRYKVNKTIQDLKVKKDGNTKELDNIYHKVKAIKELLEKIEDETISLRRIQSTALQSVFNENNHSKFEESMSLIKNTSVKARSGLRELENIKSKLANKDGQNDRVIYRVLSAQHPLLQKQYVNAMTDYQNALVTHKEKTEQLIRDQLQIVISHVTRRNITCVPVDKDVTNEELEEMIQKQDTAAFVGNYLQETVNAHQKLQDARSRHKELLQLEISISELHDMFIEMATLVELQGETSDIIEYYIGNGVDQVESGKAELIKANQSKKEARKKRVFLYICLFSIILVIILIVAIELYFTFKSP